MTEPKKYHHLGINVFVNQNSYSGTWSLSNIHVFCIYIYIDIIYIQNRLSGRSGVVVLVTATRGLCCPASPEASHCLCC